MPRSSPSPRERSTQEAEAEIRRLLAIHARLVVDVDRLSADGDLYRAGLSSYSSVILMAAIEESFAIEFADELLTRATFSSIAAILSAVAESSATANDGHR